MKIPRLILMHAVALFLLHSAKAQEQSLIELQVMDKDSTPSFIIFKETGKRFLHGQEKDVFKKYLKLSGNDELKKEKTEKDELGFTHERYTQQYKGIKVEFAEYVVHSKNGEIESINGNFKKIDKLDVTPKMAKETALQKALDYTGAKVYMWEIPEMEQWLKKEQKDATATFYPKGEIVIVQDRLGRGDMRLAYKFELYASEPMSRNYIYVDANSGAIVNTESLMLDFDANENADTRYSGSKHIDTDFLNGTYRLFDYTRGNGIEVWDMNSSGTTSSAVPFEDTDNTWSALEWDNIQKDNAALDALWAAQKTYDYFKTVHKRNSYDNLGGLIRVYVHYLENYDRAYWDKNSNSAFLGDGKTQFDALTAIDGVAHEIGHGISNKTVNLVPYGEAGALQEGLSDIWGACVEHYAAPEKETWLIGEDIEKNSFCTRSMSNPILKGDPDKYGGAKWIKQEGCIPTVANDECGVHTNCSVIGHWFYLLSEGGKGVSGVGIDDAAKIVYRMERAEYLNSNAKFVDARLASLKAARDTFGFNSNQVLQTGKAWYAVGVGGFDFLPVITDSQIKGGSSNVPYNSSNTFYITPAADTLTTGYTWSVVPYSMSCGTDKLPYITGSTTGTQVRVNHGSCTGSYILRCRANNYWCASNYQDRVITVYNPSGSGGGSGDPDPCDPTISTYPNPSIKGEYTTMQIQYPDPCDGEPYPLAVETNHELSVYDLNGNLMLSKNFSSDALTFSNATLKKGVYVLVLKDKNGKLHQMRLKVN